MYTLINGSPKPINSNSMYFLKVIGSFLDNFKIFDLKKKKYENIIESIIQSDTIVFAFPLYVDSPTSITLSFLDYIFDQKIDLNNKKVYVVINCGFREGEQNLTALKIMKQWCKKVNAIYSGSILIGAGEIVGKEKYRLVSKKALKNIKKFTTNIKLKKENFDIITTMDYLNNQGYCYLANLSWTKRGKENNLSEVDLRQK